MGRHTWVAGLVLCAGLTGWKPASAQTPASFAVQVFLQDDAGVPAPVLEQAKQAAVHVFALSSVDLQWIGHGPYQPCSLTMRIAAKPTGAMSRSRFVMGIAPETREARAIIAFAFYDRIQLYSAKLGLDAPQMLGHVMAHELGHLLLPHGAHSITGLMRGAWDDTQANQAAMGVLTFTPAEAALIQERRSACASPTAPE